MRGQAPEVDTGVYTKTVEANGKRWVNKVRVQKINRYEFSVEVEAGSVPVIRGMYGRESAHAWTEGLRRDGYRFN